MRVSQALMGSPEMLGAVEQLFGEHCRPVQGQDQFQDAGVAVVSMHTRTFRRGWDDYASLHITAMLSIDAGTVENGCLEFAAGSHRAGIIGRSWEPLTDDDLAAGEYQLIRSEPGDAVFFDSFSPHRSGTQPH